MSRLRSLAVTCAVLAAVAPLWVTLAVAEWYSARAAALIEWLMDTADEHRWP